MKFFSGVSVFFLLLCSVGIQAAPEIREGIQQDQQLDNRLGNHASPYLAMHGADPVAWQEWSSATVARAKKENKLLFVSSGYFSCHWCHVMQKESYRNPKIAAILNKHFIPVKVDRELLPALDARLIDFVEKTQGYAGWPLNVFVTPEGFPLIGMVYVPPDNFRQVLDTLQQQWLESGEYLKSVAQGAAADLAQPEVATDGTLPKGLYREFEKALVKSVLSQADEMQGGFGSQNKFPMAPQLKVLLSVYASGRDERLGKFLQTSLDHMASQGLNDQLGGGFYRYAVDPGWQIPHFEKMLYDNALLVGVYLRATKIFNKPYYEAVAWETLNFMAAELATEKQALIASLSAVDDHNVEGGVYLWSREEVKGLLTDDEFKVASPVWGLNSAPDLEGKHHLVVVQSVESIAGELKISTKRAKQRLASARLKMLAARSGRGLPRDEKQLAAWNGLALSAFAAGLKLDKAGRYGAVGQRVRDYLAGTLWDGRQLVRAMGAQGPLGDAGLEDYAYVASGVFDWWRAKQNPADLKLALALLEQGWERFYGKQGWQLKENSLLKYGLGETLVLDGPLPSPSAVLISTSLQVAKHTGRKDLETLALRALNVGREQIKDLPLWHASQIAAVGLAQSAR